MSEELRERLKEQARAHDQSLHAEIISILQAATGNPSIAMPLDIEALAATLSTKLSDEVATKVAAKLTVGLKD